MKTESSSENPPWSKYVDASTHQRILSFASDFGAIPLLTGSRIAGLGNSRSDVDVMLLCDQVPADAGDCQEMFDVTLVDFEFVSRARVGDTIAKVNSIDLDDFARLYTLSRSSFSTYFRFGSAIILDGCSTIDRSRISWPNYLSSYEVWSAVRSCSALDYALALLDSGRASDAVDQAAAAVGFAIDAFSAANGSGYPAAKWRFEKLAQSGCSSELELAWKLKAPGEIAPEAYVKSVVDVLQSFGVMGRGPCLEDFEFFQRQDVGEFFLGKSRFLAIESQLVFDLSPTAWDLWDRCQDGFSPSLLGSGDTTRLGLLDLEWRGFLERRVSASEIS